MWSKSKNTIHYSLMQLTLVNSLNTSARRECTDLTCLPFFLILILSGKGLKVGLPAFKVGLPLLKVGLPFFKVGLPVHKVGLPFFKVGLPVLKMGLPVLKLGLPVFRVGLPVFKVGLLVLFLVFEGRWNNNIIMLNDEKQMQNDKDSSYPDCLVEHCMG